MAFTSKISSVIKGAIKNKIANSIGNAMSGFSQGQGQFQATKQAAKLLNKSPLEIENINPTSHMKENPYSYGTVYYPQETSNLGDGHYIIFDVIENKKTNYGAAPIRLQGNSKARRARQHQAEKHHL